MLFFNSLNVDQMPCRDLFSHDFTVFVLLAEDAHRVSGVSRTYLVVFDVLQNHTRAFSK